MTFPLLALVETHTITGGNRPIRCSLRHIIVERSLNLQTFISSATITGTISLASGPSCETNHHLQSGRPSEMPGARYSGRQYEAQHCGGQRPLLGPAARNLESLECDHAFIERPGRIDVPDRLDRTISGARDCTRRRLTLA